MPINPSQAMRQRFGAASGRQKLAGTVGGAAVAGALIALVATWEGLRTEPYADLIGKMTVCFGETNVPMRRYTVAECEDMLGGSLNTYATAVLKRNPELAGRPNQLTAAVSLSYNIGIAAYNRSTAARFFSMRQWRAGCNAMLKWNRAGGKVRKGLVNRRAAEHRICVKDLP